MPSTYIVQIMVSSYHAKVIGSWNQFVNIEKHVKANTIHVTFQFLPLVSQQFTDTAHVMVDGVSTVLSITGNNTPQTPV